LKVFRSFRALLIFGSVLWTLGLLGIAHVFVLALLPHVPALLYADHHTIVVFGLLLMFAGIFTLRHGLSSFERLRRRLVAVRMGEAPRIEGTYPTEIEPLVHDLNALLSNRERAVSRALTTAGDLAHGLKTPLALLTQEAERAKVLRLYELASGIDQLVERMRRQVDYHLAQARAVSSGKDAGARCAVSASIDGLVRTLGKLYAERGLSVRVNVLTDHNVRAQREDLDEMLGNLLDNAHKWAKTTVAIGSAQTRTSIVITVEDDGPGLAPMDREKVLQRGVRADEAAPGSGLGLAIVRDLAELYGGTISLYGSDLGGLQARLELPMPNLVEAARTNVHVDQQGH
jgi:signal transduction histidine kinase